jgi:hypothetical protein
MDKDKCWWMSFVSNNYILKFCFGDGEKTLHFALD